MAKSIDPQLAAQLREESEATMDAPYPKEVIASRPNQRRSRVYSVRLSAEEEDALTRVAGAKHLPTSTLVRSWILERLAMESDSVAPVSSKEVAGRLSLSPNQGAERMGKGDIHTSKQGDRWVNKAEGNSRASSSSSTKAEAQAKGREMAIERGVEHVIHNKDGKIGERNTYPRSRDPRSSKG